MLPAGKLLVRIVNSGDQGLAYGPQPSVDRLTAHGWRPQAFENKGVPVGFPDAEYRLVPGKTSPCLEVPVSDYWIPGLYRVGFKLDEIHASGDSAELRPTAYFRVD